MSTDAVQLLRGLVERRRPARELVLKRADLRGAQLARLRADGLDLEESDLRGGVFAAVQWRGCKLRDAQLDEADFTEAVLRMCDLDQVRASRAVLARARLENSTARGARFDNADLRGAVLTETDFSRASFRGANLEGASASGADLRGADLSGARLRGAVLVDADLRGADLTGADLEGADLHGADLRGAIGAPVEPADGEQPAPVMPPEWKPLADTMTPIVLEVLRSAGRRGGIDPETAARAIQSLEAGASPVSALPLESMNAVVRVLSELGDGILPVLLVALRQPGSEPPLEVMAMIRRLGEALAIDDASTAEDILARLTGKPTSQR